MKVGIKKLPHALDLPLPHYAVTPDTTSLLLDVFTVKLPGWRFLSQDFPDLLDGQAGSWIGYARSVVKELAVQGIHCQAAHGSTSPWWI